jgi:uncharacterized membrane protein
MKAARSWLGALAAAIYAIVFGAVYVDYLHRVGEWFADLAVVGIALPFTLVMRWVSNGEFSFSGDQTAKVVAAAAFGCALAYIGGAIVEAALRALYRLIRARA